MQGMHSTHANEEHGVAAIGCVRNGAARPLQRPQPIVHLQLAVGRNVISAALMGTRQQGGEGKGRGDGQKRDGTRERDKTGRERRGGGG